MIGPLLPSVNDDESGNIQKEETSDMQPNSQVESASCEQQGSSFVLMTVLLRICRFNTSSLV